MQFIDLAKQYQANKAKIDERIHKVLDHGSYIMGPEVKELEKNLSDYTGNKYCKTVANGTDALQLSLMLLDIGEGDAVFTTSFTFFATVEVIAFAGATTVFADINPDTFNICPKLLEESIVKTIEEGKLRPKAIIAVDLFGLPSDYTEIKAIAKKYNLTLIEDAAQGFGGSIGSTKSCKFGDISTTSFFPAKPLGCYGDGGAIFTDNEEYASIIESLRVHGKGKDKYDNVRIGVNSRLDTVQAAVLLEKLSIFDWELEQRNLIAQEYRKQLTGVEGLILPTVPEGYVSSWAQYTLRVSNRDLLQSELKKHNVPTAIYYPTPMHKLTAMQNKYLAYDDLSLSEKASGEVVSLPMHPYLALESVQEIAEIVRRVNEDRF